MIYSLNNYLLTAIYLCLDPPRERVTRKEENRTRLAQSATRLQVFGIILSVINLFLYTIVIVTTFTLMLAYMGSHISTES